MKPKSLIAIAGLLAILLSPGIGAYAQTANAQTANNQSTSQTALKATPPKAIPVFSTVNLGRQGFYYAGGQYVTAGAALGDRANEKVMRGAMYVDVWVPKEIRQPYPIVFFHGNGQTATDWMQTPDGRPGWAYYLLAQGYVLYMVDYPTRGRSAYVPGHDGNIGIRTADQLEEIWTNVKERSDYYLKDNHTQWPGTGKMGDPVFDTFVKSQVQFAQAATAQAGVAARELLDTIGSPVIIFAHSQGGGVAYGVAEARPNQVKGMIIVEPGGSVRSPNFKYDPPITNVNQFSTYEAPPERPGEEPCIMQRDPVRKLVNWGNIPILNISGNGGYHRAGDACGPKWMNQAGAKVEFVRLEDVGMNGNGHQMMFELNSEQIIAFIDDWLRKNTLQGAPNPSRAMPPAAIPTFSTEHLGAKAFYYSGGEYVEAQAAFHGNRAGEKIMRGAMYMDVWVPKVIRQPYPIVFFHGNGQTGVDWQQTPDGRAGWAYYLLSQGYVLYMVDYPARGRSAYVPGYDGNVGIRTADQLEEIWTNVAARGNFPLKNNHTQWPGAGKVGDPVFDTFNKTQVHFAGASTELARHAAVALLDTIGTPVILLTHSQGGGVGWDVAERRPSLVKSIVTVEPGGPQIGGVNTATVEPGPRNANSWGLTTNPFRYDPPITSPSQLNVRLEEKSDRPGEVRCWLQTDPVRKLANFQNIRVLSISGNGTYHRVYDPCIPKWLNQAGVRTDFVRLEDAGMSGNGHMMMLEKNSDQIIRVVDDWIKKNVPPPAAPASTERTAAQ
jgi:pimeloyl-ACP methyl ester carboxylesterase